MLGRLGGSGSLGVQPAGSRANNCRSTGGGSLRNCAVRGDMGVASVRTGTPDVLLPRCAVAPASALPAVPSGTLTLPAAACPAASTPVCASVDLLLVASP